eukprot:GILK01006391.1.p1 GENE.GILK01006391.1~~GILK01006391.1.p1  ORF type:complete len:725 (-),score=115.18 GILK01006391.1:125-2299(-)
MSEPPLGGQRVAGVFTLEELEARMASATLAPKPVPTITPDIASPTHVSAGLLHSESPGQHIMNSLHSSPRAVPPKDLLAMHFPPLPAPPPVPYPPYLHMYMQALLRYRQNLIMQRTASPSLFDTQEMVDAWTARAREIEMSLAATHAALMAATNQAAAPPPGMPKQEPDTLRLADLLAPKPHAADPQKQQATDGTRNTDSETSPPAAVSAKVEKETPTKAKHVSKQPIACPLCRNQSDIKEPPMFQAFQELVSHMQEAHLEQPMGRLPPPPKDAYAKPWRVRGALDLHSPAPPSYIERISTDCQRMYHAMVPSQESVEQKQEILHRVESALQNIWPDARLYMFGSSGNGFSVKNSDLDLCLCVSFENAFSPSVLAEIVQAFSKGLAYALAKETLFSTLCQVLRNVGMEDVAWVNARVAVAKFISPPLPSQKQSIKADICLNNLLAIKNTRLVFDYCRFDARVQILGLVIKNWAKQRGINSPAQRTLSSYGFIVLLIHFLQRTSPPVLPCFQNPDDSPNVPVGPEQVQRRRNSQEDSQKWIRKQSMESDKDAAENRSMSSHPIAEETLDRASFDDRTEEDEGRLRDEDRMTSSNLDSDRIDGFDCSYCQDWSRFQHMAGKNRETVGSLLINFFRYYSAFDWRTQVVGIRRLGMITKEDKRWGKKERYICIEDPFEVTHDLGGVVSGYGCELIRAEMKRGFSLLTTTGSLQKLCAPQRPPQDSNHY